MEHYNDVYLQQLAPLIKVSINEDIDQVSSQLVLNWLKNYDISGKVWDNSIISDRLSNLKYRIKVVDTDDISYLDEYKSNGKEHSKLSPFNANSDLFPNGILSEKWIAKYSNDYPFAMIMVYKLGDTGEQVKLADKILILKNKLIKFGIKLVVIITSSSDSGDLNHDDHYESRINELRSLTQISKNHMVCCRKESDYEVVIDDLMKNLKSMASSFYKLRELKIQQRNEKFYTCPSTISINTGIEITPLFLETRNLLKQAILCQFYQPHNLQPAVKLLEIAYNNLTEIVLDCFNGKLIKQYNLSDHDLNLYFQFRNLIDIIAFHIVRGYFSLDDPLQALKKHGAHVAIITEIANFQYDSKYVTRYWQSIQFKWLGQLMQKIPSSLISNIKIPQIKKNSTVLSYFGGVKVVDKLSYEVYLTPDLNYIHAYFLLDSPITSISPRDFLLSTLIPEDIKTLKVNLLESAINYLESHENSLQSKTAYVSCLLAEELHSLSLEEALFYYENSLKHMNNKHFQNIVLLKLLDEYQNLNPSKFLITLIQLVTFGGKPKKVFSSLSLQDIEGVSIMFNMIEVESLIVSQNLSNETYIYENCTTQLILKSKCNLNDLARALPNYRVELLLKRIEINYNSEDKTEISAFKSVILHNSSTSESLNFNPIDIEVVDNHLEGSLNLELFNDPKIIQFTQPAQMAGTFNIQSIVLHGLIKIDEIEFDIHQIQTIEPQLNRDVKFYKQQQQENNDTNLCVKWLRLNNDCNKIQIKPVKPSVQLIFEPIDNICIGEKVSIPVRIQFRHPKHKLIKYQSLELVPIIRILSDGQTESGLTSLVNWDGLKDDEPLSINELTEDEVGRSKTHGLHILVNKSTTENMDTNKTIKNSNNSCTLMIDIKTRVTELENKIESIYENYSIEYPIIKKIFDLNLIISPRFDEDEATYMPSPFFIPEDTQNLVLPIPVRLWLGNVEIKKCLDIDIINIEFDIKPNINEVIIEKKESTTTTTSTSHHFHQLFTTKSKNGYSHRTITTTTVVKITWKRKNNDMEQIFTSDEWEIVLPLSDPRVLLKVEPEKSSNKIMFKYILENPTPRIFNFTTQLFSEIDWRFEDKRNIVPLKQEPFSILPFSRHVMIFYGQHLNSLNNDSGITHVKLPNFKVYDIDYKFGLPTLSVDENIFVKSGVLYWKRK